MEKSVSEVNCLSFFGRYIVLVDYCYDFLVATEAPPPPPNPNAPLFPIAVLFYLLGPILRVRADILDIGRL